MNRSEQEQLFRQSREVMFRAASSEALGTAGAAAGEDIVLSVLKSPLAPRQPNHRQQRASLSAAVGGGSGSGSGSGSGAAAFAEDDETFDEGDGEELRRLKRAASHDEDTEDTDTGQDDVVDTGLAPGRRFAFLEEQLRRLRGPRVPRFGEAHHKRVPTPIKKRRHRKDARHRHSKPDQMDDDDDEMNDEMDDEPVDGVVDPALAAKHGPARKPPGVPDPYYPIYLPIDQAFKAKYVFHHKKGKTFQERVYVFLEHPGGWLCFVYHFTVDMADVQEDPPTKCPFNLGHVMPESRLHKHIDKCSKKFSSSEMAEKLGSGNERCYAKLPQEENWDDCTYESSYETSVAFANSPKVPNLQGVTKSERKGFRPKGIIRLHTMKEQKNKHEGEELPKLRLPRTVSKAAAGCFAARERGIDINKPIFEALAKEDPCLCVGREDDDNHNGE